MRDKLPNWCKAAKMQMIKKDISVGELAEAVGVTRQYVSAVINGRMYGDGIVKKISDYLNINEQYSP